MDISEKLLSIFDTKEMKRCDDCLKDNYKNFMPKYEFCSLNDIECVYCEYCEF